MPGVHGVAPVPELHRGFTVNGKDNCSTMLDLDKLKALAQTSQTVAGRPAWMGQ